ncbi:MAG: hypothetical protein WC637_04570 [Victivallales bacterium]|jgi:guanylate kinase
MSEETKGRLVILSGPSCVGKSPLSKAIAKFHPELRETLQPLVLYNSRSARPGEVDGVDYHFRSRSQVDSLKGRGHFAVMDVRGDLQALDLQELSASLAKGNVFFEGNPFVGRALQTRPELSGVNRLSVFMSPLSREEILFLKTVEPSVSIPELKEAHCFQYVIPNHDGEDSENWDAFYHPIGDARMALLAFVSLLTGKTPAHVEKWEEGMIP